MNAAEILKRDAELRAMARNTPWRTEPTSWGGGTRLRTSAQHEYPAMFIQEPDHPQMAQTIAYLANIAAAERALIEAAAALYAATGGEFTDSPICTAYRVLLAAMEAAQQ